MATDHPTTRAVPLDQPPTKPAKAPEQYRELDARVRAAAGALGADRLDMIAAGGAQ